MRQWRPEVSLVPALWDSFSEKSEQFEERLLNLRRLLFLGLAADRLGIVIASVRQSRVSATGRMGAMRLGIAHHFGWAVAVTASEDRTVVDRRRIELVEPGTAVAPIHHEGGPHLLHRSGEPLDDEGLAQLVADVRSSVARSASAALDELEAALPGPIDSLSLRGWPTDFPKDVAVQRRVPYESRADSVMYCQVLNELAQERGWSVHTYDAKTVEDDAIRILGERANGVLRSPKSTIGPPWSKDHRMALAATIVAT